MSHVVHTPVDWYEADSRVDSLVATSVASGREIARCPGQFPKAKDQTMSNRPVLITTEFRGVFFGYAEDTTGENVTLTNARNCIYWPSENGGFAGLASEGPAKGARIGAKVSKIDLRKVTSVTEVTPAAAEKWEAANVYRG